MAAATVSGPAPTGLMCQAYSMTPPTDRDKIPLVSHQLIIEAARGASGRGGPAGQGIPPLPPTPAAALPRAPPISRGVVRRGRAGLGAASAAAP